MVAVMKFGESLRRPFHYNEIKVEQGVAKLLMASNYPMDMDAMHKEHRIGMLQKIADRRPSIGKMSLHISVNFSPGDVLDTEKIKKITAEYMEAIGFGNQPFLVYQHFDAAHPHVHIVTTIVRPDATVIGTKYIGKHVSGPATRKLEEQYGLVKATDQKRELFRLKVVALKKVEYGRVETKRAISNVLDAVLEGYKYSSLHQLNAVLNLYNIRAEDGRDKSLTKNYKGLTYRLLDDNKNPVGVRVKASLFYQQPTLKYLEKKFVAGKLAKDKLRMKLKNEIDLAFLGKPMLNKEQLTEILQKKGIDLLLRHTADQKIYGVTFVDHRSKCVFNGSEISKAYSANALQQRFQDSLQSQVKVKTHRHTAASRKSFPGMDLLSGKSKGLSAGISSMIAPQNEFHKSLVEVIFQHEYAAGTAPGDFTKKRHRRKKRRRRIW